MKKPTLILFLLILLAGNVAAQEITFSGGDGTVTNPYQITTAKQLADLATEVNKGNATYRAASYRLMNDISLSDYGENWNEGKGWIPIGNSIDNSFRGVFDGNMYSISDLYVSNSEVAGLFGFVIRPAGQVKNLIIKASKIKATASSDRAYAGGLVGFYNSQEPIDNCYVIADSVIALGSGTTSVAGGIAGFSIGKISNSYSTANVSAVSAGTGSGSLAGGLAGAALAIENSYSTGNISVSGAESSIAGGLVGQGSDITYSGESLSELLNRSKLTILRSYSTGDVSAQNYAGGLVGSTIGTSNISNSYSIGNISANHPDMASAGGLIGMLMPMGGSVSLSNSYSIGNVSAISSSNNLGITTSYYGGLVGYVSFNSIYVTNSYYDLDGVQGSVAGNQAKSIDEFKNKETFIDWDFEHVWGIDAEINGGYPYLLLPEELTSCEENEILVERKCISKLITFSGGDGTSENPYQITTAVQLSDLAIHVNISNTNYNTAHYKLMNNISISDYGENWNDGKGWIPIGNRSNRFEGVFDGNGKVITGLFINNSNDYQGLFGFIQDAVIKNLGIENIKINGGNYVGGLTGVNYEYGGSIIENSYVTGNIIGINYIGGLIGCNYSMVINSYAIGNVTGTNHAGGLIGENNAGTVENSYAIVNITGDNIGGLIDYNNGSVINSYYNGEISKKNDFEKGEPRTTLQMKQESTFEGWNFEDVWNVNTKINGGFPYLRSFEYKDDGENSCKEDEIFVGGQCLIVISPIKYISFSGGDGTSENPYQITIAEQLVDLAVEINKGSFIYSNAYYKLMNNISLSDYDENWNEGKGWVPIGNFDNRFKGVFDGNGKIITGLFINNTKADERDQGLFGVIESAVVKNIGVKDFNITGVLSVGGLVGGSYKNSIIENSYATGKITGSDYVGVLAGYNNGGSIIENTYAVGIVTAPMRTGGLLGENNGGTVENSFAIGIVTGNNNIGGLIGYGRGTVISSYYNRETTEQNDKDKGTPKSSDEMKTQSTYIDWDFTDVWAIDSKINGGYPYLLSFEYEEDEFTCKDNEMLIEEECVDGNTPITLKITSSKIKAQATSNAIILQNLPSNSKVEVYNLKGGRIYLGNTGNISTLNIEVLTKGMYIVKATSGSGRQVMRVAVR